MKKREQLGLNTEHETIDLEKLTGSRKSPSLNAKQIAHVGEVTGFFNRDPMRSKKIPRQPTPYIIQRNFKFRVGMSELVEQTARRLGLKSQQAIEQGLLALIEKNDLDDLKAEFKKIMKG
jgi:hypothetical protein